MMVKALSYVVAAVCIFTSAASFAQTRATPARYYSSSYGTPAGGRYVGFSHGGCADCGVAVGDGGCDSGCDFGCGGPGRCGGCHRCCPRILPAVARGVGAVADFVGCTLDVIFCRPGGCGGCGGCDSCRAPRQCCVRRPRCGCGMGCGDGCGCGDGGFDSVIPGEIHGEPIPAAPPAAATRVYRSQATARPIVAPKQQVARKAAPTKRNDFATSQASAQVEVSRKSPVAPRELKVDDHAVALDPFGDAPAAAPSVRPVSTKSATRSLPANPLR